MTNRIRTRRRPPPDATAPERRDASARAQAPSAAAHSGDYAVGYGKPPRHTQFKKGRSGNPRGRPKGAKNLSTELAEELQERIALREGGARRVVSKQRAMLKRLMEKALQGDARSASLVINMVARFLDQSAADAEPTVLAEEDQAILEAFEARIRASIK